MARKTVLAIGIDPAFVDFSAFPGYSPELLRNHTDAQIARLGSLGYDAESCLIDLGDTAEAVVAKALRMNVIAWSQNLTSDAAAAAGARLVSKEELLRTADVISIHMMLSARTIGLIGAAELAATCIEAFAA